MARRRDKHTEPFEFVHADDRRRYDRQREAFEHIRREQAEREEEQRRREQGGGITEYRIFGPPGTGKTTKLSAWARKAAEKFGNDAVIICSLTRAAAAEIASRDVPVVRRNVGTMHSLCFRMLGQPEVAEAKTGSWNDEHPAMALDIKTKGKGQDAFAEVSGGGWGTKMYESMSLARARMIPPEKWPSDVQRFYDKWEEWKGENALVDFTDMIQHVLEEGITPDECVRVACFDEVQDFSKLELQLARLWGHDMDYVVLVGDPDQAIFEWRGASPRDFLEPAVPEENIRVLEKSYRVPKAVHEVATEWIERCSYRFPTKYEARESDGCVEYMQGSSYMQPKRIADAIEQCVADDKSCMAIMSCGYMLQPLIKELRTRGVPFHNPYAELNGAWNPLRAKGRLSAFLVASMSAHDEKARTWTWGELWQWVEILDAGKVLERCAKGVIKGEAKDEARRALTPTEHDLSVLFKPDAYASLCEALGDEPGTDVAWLIENTLPSKQKLIGYCARVYLRHGFFALHQNPKVVVGTIHSVKGAEADTVFVAPDLSRQGGLQWAAGSEKRDAVLRVFYVAFTRARERLVLLGSGGAFAVSW